MILRVNPHRDFFSVSTIQDFAYGGPPLPEPDYRPDSVLADWQVAGPLARTDDRLARDPEARGGVYASGGFFARIER